jgi:hypothetical protein
MSWILDKERLQAEARKLDPAIRLTTKDSWFWRMLAWLLFILSFGKFKREDFLTLFATTLGHVQAYPKEWETASVERVMIHESRHSWQARVCGFGIHPMVGLPLMAFLYGLFPFPTLLAVFRLWFEMDADRAYWRHGLVNHTMDAAEVRRRAQSFAETVSGPAYFWSVWRGFAVWLFMRAAEKVIVENLAI